MSLEPELHPIVTQMRPSSEQRKPILTRGKDVVVTAGAGTGKTRTLVARYLSLLADGLSLRSIVAITFTRKAAREMRNRVREEIRKYLQHLRHQDPDRRMWVKIYDALDAARISTIHTLCAEILRHHPAESGVDPAFEMMEEGRMALLQAQAVEEALGWGADDPETVKLFSELGTRNLQNMLRQMMAKRLEVHQALEEAPQDLWRTWQGQLLEPLRDFLDHGVVQDHFRALLSLRQDGTLQGALSAGDNLAPDLKRALEIWDELQAARAEGDWGRVSRLLFPLRQSLKQKGRKDNWAPARPKDRISVLQSLYDEKVEPLVKKGMDLTLDRRLAQEIIPALSALFLKTDRIYARAKERDHMLDFDDLEWKAVALLRDNPGIRTYWQEQIRALLVDEFQDTNNRQRELIDLLTTRRNSLFIVGDSKQSIYRFRGADVAVFQEEKKQVTSRGEGYHLVTSYRAHRRLLELLNVLLRPVLGSKEPEKPFIAPFEKLGYHRQDPRQGVEQPFVEIHLAVGSKGDGALDHAARALVYRLKQMIEGSDQGAKERDDAGVSGLDYGDIAILCRASTAFPAYENALEDASIPFLTISGRGFYERPEVRDVLNILNALADPYHDLALAGLLRSPAFGLSDMALYRLRQMQREGGFPSLYDALMAGNLRGLKGEQRRADRARSLITSFRPKVGRVRVGELMKEVLDRTHYLATLYRANQSRSVNNVSKLLADAHQSGFVSISQFLNYVQELRDVSVREGEAQAVSAGAVQVMTVHQAKGLEFPVVVLGDISRGTPRIRQVMIDEDFGILPPFSQSKTISITEGAEEELTVRSAAYRLAKEREADEEAAESDRLLYVAATRAQEKLLLSGTLDGIKKDGTPHKLGGWLEKITRALDLQDLSIPYDPAGSSVHEFNIHEKDHPVLCAIYEPEVNFSYVSAPQGSSEPEAWPDDLSLIEPLATQEALDLSQDGEEERQVWRVVSGGRGEKVPPWLLGKLVHQALAEWRFPGGNSRDFERWVAMEARSSGLTEDPFIETAVSETVSLLRRFIGSELYLDMDRAKQRLHEVPFTYQLAPDQIIQGKIDALYRTHDHWVLVEFKTDEINTISQRDHLVSQRYRRQVNMYRKASERLLNQRPRTVLCFLNFQDDLHLLKSI